MTQIFRVMGPAPGGFCSLMFRLTKVYALLVRRGVEASYATVRRYAIRELGWRKKKSTILLEAPPASQAA